MHAVKVHVMLEDMMETIGTISRSRKGAPGVVTPPVLGFVFAAAAGARKWIKVQVVRWRSRRVLLELTDEQLKDIGLSRRDAEREGKRFFWEHGGRGFDAAPQPRQASDPAAHRRTSAEMRSPAE